MKFFDYIRFGLKNIGRQKARTILTIFAIMIGATSVVAMLTIVFSAKKIVFSQIESAGALTQITVSGNTDTSGDDVFNTNGGGGSSDSVKITDDIVTKVAALSSVNSASPMLGAWNLRDATLDGKKVTFDSITGIVPGPATDQQISAGRNLVSTDKYSVVLGSRYLNKLGYKDKAADLIGKTLTFTVSGYTGIGADVPKPVMTGSRSDGDAYQQQIQNLKTTFQATIVGVLGSPLYDSQVFIPMQWARQMTTSQHWDMVQQDTQYDSQGRPLPMSQEMHLVTDDFFAQQGYSVIVVKVDQSANVAGVATKIKAMNLGAATAQEMIDQMAKVFNLLGLVLGAVGAISLAVAAIGVINTMVMATLERTREIGVLRACGATKSSIRRLFTFEAALLGFWGGVAGVGVGYLLIFAARHFGGDALTTQGVDVTQIQIPLWLGLITVGATTLIGMLAGYFPAIRAARLNPVEALRYE